MLKILKNVILGKRRTKSLIIITSNQHLHSYKKQRGYLLHYFDITSHTTNIPIINRY